MTVQITIIGLGQIGTSIGLALAGHTDRIRRVGYDRQLDVQNKAKSLGAFDAVKFNLASAVDGADGILLCIPFDQVEQTLKNIAPDLKQNAVVMDFSAQKSMAYKWFEQYVATGRHYVGLVPTINPMYIDQSESGINAARADLFEKATIGIAIPPGTPAEAMKLADDLVHLVNANTIFLDMLEADGMLMTVHLLPQIMSAALLNATVGQPGWVEARRFAGQPFARSTSALGADPLESLSNALLSNPLSAMNALDNAIGALTYIRTAVQKSDHADLEKRLNLAFDDRENWLNERQRAQWDIKTPNNELPKASDAIKRMFIGDRSKDKKKKA